MHTKGSMALCDAKKSSGSIDCLQGAASSGETSAFHDRSFFFQYSGHSTFDGSKCVILTLFMFVVKIYVMLTICFH